MPSPVLLVHHAANRGHNHPPNSISALRACLEAGARAIEVDISPLADGRFALLHGPGLERSTTGSGPASRRTAAEVSQLHHVWQGQVTTERVGLLEDAIELVSDHPGSVELQLDLKPHSYLSGREYSRLAATLRPVKERVRISSVADWMVRDLCRIDADLQLGFDPMLYLDVNGQGGDQPTRPPLRVGAYGYRDEHPLSNRQWGKSSDYLAARAEALQAQVPVGLVWYVAASLLIQVLHDGFDWIAYLHDQGAEVDAWTLDPDRPGDVALARRLIRAGADRITTNNAPALAALLSHATIT